MTELVAQITLSTSTSINDALMLPVSLADSILKSKSLEDLRKNNEAKAKVSYAIVDRLNGVISAIGALIKSRR